MATINAGDTINYVVLTRCGRRPGSAMGKAEQAVGVVAMVFADGDYKLIDGGIVAAKDVLSCERLASR